MQKYFDQTISNNTILRTNWSYNPENYDDGRNQNTCISIDEPTQDLLQTYKYNE